MAEVAQCLAVAENELLFGLARARAVKKFGPDFALKACQDYGRAGLKVLHARLRGRDGLAGPQPARADVACYPYVALAPEGEVPVDDWSNVLPWLRRTQGLPGYVGMEGIADGG